MNNAGTAQSAAGLTGMPFAVAVIALLFLAAVAIRRGMRKEERLTAITPLGGALLMLYLLWSAWFVLFLTLIALAVGLISKLSIFARVRQAGAAAMKAAREPVVATTPAPRGAAAE